MVLQARRMSRAASSKRLPAGVGTTDPWRLSSSFCPISSSSLATAAAIAGCETPARAAPLVKLPGSAIAIAFAEKNGGNGIVKEIARRRAKVVVPLFLCSFAMYVATLVALSYFPGLVGYKILGSINLAYALALAQFAITFLTAFIYAVWVRRAIDPLIAEALAILGRPPAIGSIR